jgi:hypothetical protein
MKNSNMAKQFDSHKIKIYLMLLKKAVEVLLISRREGERLA